MAWTYAWTAAVCAGGAVWLWLSSAGRNAAAGRMDALPHHEDGRRNVGSGWKGANRRSSLKRHVPDTLVLALLDAAIRQGASIPSALDAVGECLLRCGDGTAGRERLRGRSPGPSSPSSGRSPDSPEAAIGVGLCAVAAALLRGVGWDAAWTLACADAGDDLGGGRLFRALQDALGPSWRQGVPPSARLNAMMEQMDADERARIETSTAKLSVRLLLPTGLCFLPSFIMIGIVPSIVSFIA
ncbi:pilus assembly protein [Bifidobacterium samirii]|uniref:Pilus assembly protein n=2 Tax=Bifidobacterium samirii TaxID=2306974 RepID=A0A430FP43_9BIFI|nr:pilus assembly protein [Bifidobacterium samirii]